MAVKFPQKEHLEAFVENLKKASLLQEYMPECSDEWYEVVCGCLQSVQLPYFNGKVSNTAAYIFYKLCKNHRLSDGNKRTALLTTSAFLIYNDFFPIFSSEALYQLADHVAATNSSDSEAVIEGLKFTFGWSIDLLESVD